MNILKHMLENLFITATGIAALIHSTWAVGTIFAGNQPDPQSEPLAFFGWLIPALLIAFSFDIGQIYTSGEIRAGDKRKRKYATFIFFAVGTYFLQWLYIVHHMPALELAGGVSENWQPIVKSIRDMSIWLAPALLPMSTTLYTLSQSNDSDHVEQTKTARIGITAPHYEQLPQSTDDDFLAIEEDTAPYKAMSQPAKIEKDKNESVTKVVMASSDDECHCENCNKLIKAPRSNQKFCGIACRQEAYRKRQIEVSS